MSGNQIIPPRRGVPASAPQKMLAGMSAPLRTEPGGPVRSALWGWLAKIQARALGNVAERTRSETALLKAQEELAAAYEAAALKVNRLKELPRILVLDDAKFDAEYDAEYDAIEERESDREQARELRRYARQKEIEDARAALVEAQRQRFTSAQGYENQRRLKDRNLKTWEARAETFQLDAEAKATRGRGQLGVGGGADDFRRQAEAALAEAHADGDDAEADRWQKVIDALGLA
jgi:hypothetical protein